MPMNTARESKFKAKRVTRQYVQKINAAPSVIHALICPVKEAEWLEGWDYELIFSQSGLAEYGCVFTSQSAGEETIWIITKRDDVRCETEFARITPGSRAALVAVSIHDGGHLTSRVTIRYTITALTEAGNQFIDNFTEENFVKDMQFWEATMNHYLKTGKALPQSDAAHWLKYESDQI
jgi:phenylpyruvate tautomerase PptA (4-oxalocrotonate tautomerase family)